MGGWNSRNWLKRTAKATFSCHPRGQYRKSPDYATAIQSALGPEIIRGRCWWEVPGSQKWGRGERLGPEGMWAFGVVRSSGLLSHFLQPGDYLQLEKQQRLVHRAWRKAGVRHLQERKEHEKLHGKLWLTWTPSPELLPEYWQPGECHFRQETADTSPEKLKDPKGKKSL